MQGPCAKTVRLFGLYLYLAGRCGENPQSAGGAAHCKSGPGNNMVSRPNHPLYNFSITIHPRRQFLDDKLLKKKNWLREILIEQIIEFEMRGFGHLVVHVPPQLIIFMTKISRENLRLDYYLLLNIAGDNVPYFPLPCPNHLQNLTSKGKILNVFWTYNISKRRIEQFNFFSDQIALK